MARSVHKAPPNLAKWYILTGFGGSIDYLSAHLLIYRYAKAVDFLCSWSQLLIMKARYSCDWCKWRLLCDAHWWASMNL